MRQLDFDTSTTSKNVKFGQMFRLWISIRMKKNKYQFSIKFWKYFGKKWAKNHKFQNAFPPLQALQLQIFFDVLRTLWTWSLIFTLFTKFSCLIEVICFVRLCPRFAIATLQQQREYPIFTLFAQRSFVFRFVHFLSSGEVSQFRLKIERKISQRENFREKNVLSQNISRRTKY